MNREEIIEKWGGMESRERDAWVAEVVMGADVVGGNVEHILGGFRPVPRYTSDISAAWAVLEHMNADHYVSVERLADCINSTGDYVCECGGFSGWGTAPEAICLAAIIAKLTD
jgi:hypothetical protein